MGHLVAFAESLRPRQWTKNLILLAGVIFAQRFTEVACVKQAVLGVLVFCLASGVVYVFNDIVDVEWDRRHPYKRLRPIASGRLPVHLAFRMALFLMFAVLVAAWLLGQNFLAIVLVFLLWNWLYTRFLKKLVVLDVVGIGMSFVIRAVAGVIVLEPVCDQVNISPWLLFCTFFLSLFLGFCKRRDELIKVAPREEGTRSVLREYSEPMLNALIGSSFGLTLMTYSLYTVWPSTVAHFGTRDLVFTLPFVFIGMGRYLYLVFREGRGGRPHEILLNDLFLQVMVIGWIIVAIRIIGGQEVGA